MKTGMIRNLVFISLFVLFGIGAAGAQEKGRPPHPLEGADTSSPRATLRSFISITNEAYRIYLAGEGSRRSTILQARRTIERATRCLDLSEIPPTASEELSLKAHIQLFDILHRIDLPPYEAIPDATAYQDKEEARWTIPHTQISIARVNEGPRSGEFLFTPETIARAGEFYERIQSYPYRRKIVLENPYLEYLSSSGWMIPATWVKKLPAWTKILVLGQTVWQWILMGLLLIFAFGVVRAANRWSRGGPRDRSLRSYLRRLLLPGSILILMPLLRYLTTAQIGLSPVLDDPFLFLLTTAFYFAVAWFIWLVAGLVAEAIITSPRIHPESLDAHLVRMVARVLGIAIVVILLFRGAQELGIPVAGLITGFGIGGLALALAARPSIENFIGSLTLFTDRPIRVGDFCRYGEKLGTVEEIGLRSTRIRGLDRTLNTIPNSQFSEMQLINYTWRDQMLLQTVLGLRYETTPEQLRFVLARLRELLLAHPRVTNEPARARFVGFSDCSVNVEIFAYIRTRDWNEFLGIQEDILLRVMNILKEAGTGLAFPSRTIYHARDEGLPGDRVQAAEAEVRAWRSEGALPFPEFADDHRRQIRNTLDYPPEGSPGSAGQKKTGSRTS